jgi:hypothetical protein
MERIGGWCLNRFGAFLAAGVVLSSVTLGWTAIAALFGANGLDSSASAAVGFFAVTSIVVLLFGLSLQAVSAAITWSPRDKH